MTEDRQNIITENEEKRRPGAFFLHIVMAIIMFVMLAIDVSPSFAGTTDTYLYAAFTGNGIWKWDGYCWSKIATTDPALMVASGSNVYGSFPPGGGIWKWDGFRWTQVLQYYPYLMTASSSTLYGAFTNYGIYKWDGSIWTPAPAPNVDPDLIAASSSTLYGDFIGYGSVNDGIYKSVGGSPWSPRIKSDNAQAMVASASNLYGSFAGNGISQYDGSSWLQITTINPGLMVASESYLYGSFGGNGVYKWDGTWTHLPGTNSDPQVMAASDDNFYGSYAGNGIWEWDWDGSNWTMKATNPITTSNAFSMVAASRAAGSLDPTFGTCGIVTTTIGSYDDYAWALGIQSDGKIVVAGFSSNGSDFDFALERYNTNGALDATFGTGGIVTTPVGSANDYAYAIGIQSDGKIVVAGDSQIGSNFVFALARYNTNGALDTTFGTGGIVTTPVGISNAAWALGIQSDGKIVVAGNSYNGSNGDFALARYDTNGALDTTFGTGGIVTTPIGSSDDYAYALGIQSDGKIVAAGFYYNGSNNDFALARYNTNGALDTTFGTGGIVTTPIGSGDDYAFAIGIQSDGKIVVGGFYKYNSEKNWTAIVRYNANGALDTTFGTGGIVTAPYSIDNEGYALGIQSDGKIVGAGKSYNGSNYDFVLGRMNANGTPDSTFGTGGIVITPIGSSDDYAHALGIQSDGRIVVAGYFNNGSSYDIVLARYWP